jgi:hypothetical protein
MSPAAFLERLREQRHGHPAKLLLVFRQEPELRECEIAPQVITG